MGMRDRILALMMQNQIGYLSGEQIAAECGISRAAVWKHIDQLKKLAVPSMQSRTADIGWFLCQTH